MTTIGPITLFGQRNLIGNLRKEVWQKGEGGVPGNKHLVFTAIQINGFCLIRQADTLLTCKVQVRRGGQEFQVEGYLAGEVIYMLNQETLCFQVFNTQHQLTEKANLSNTVPYEVTIIVDYPLA